MSRLTALIKKESFQMVRDPSSFMIAVVLSAILLLLYGYGVSLDANNIKIGLVIQDNSPEVQSLIRAFKNTKFFDVDISRNRDEIEKEIIAGRLRGMVVIRPDFTERLRDPHDIAKIQVIADGSETNTAAFVQNYARGIYQTWLEQMNIAQAGGSVKVPISIQTRYWFNSELKSNYFLLPGSIATIMTLIGALLTSLVVAREWERGTMEALMATPVNMVEIIMGKLIPYFLLGMGSMIICTTAAIFLFGVPFRGSFLVLTVVSTIFLLVALEQGLLISTLTKNQFLASEVALITAYLPGFILSGFIFEIRSMPEFIQLITYIIPARYFVSCLQTLFLAGNVYSVIIPNVIALVIIGIFLFAILLRKTEKRLS